MDYRDNKIIFLDDLKAVWKAKELRGNFESIQNQVLYFSCSLIQITPHITLLVD
jgi:hypothetical protein